MRYLAADVYYQGNKAGRLSREDGFYRFLYDREYVIRRFDRIGDENLHHEDMM